MPPTTRIRHLTDDRPLDGRLTAWCGSRSGGLTTSYHQATCHACRSVARRWHAEQAAVDLREGVAR